MNLLLLLLACGTPAPLEKPNPPPDWPMTNGEGVDGSRVSAEKAAQAKSDAEDAEAAEAATDDAESSSPQATPEAEPPPEAEAPSPGSDPSPAEPPPGD